MRKRIPESRERPREYDGGGLYGAILTAVKVVSRTMRTLFQRTTLKAKLFAFQGLLVLFVERILLALRFPLPGVLLIGRFVLTEIAQWAGFVLTAIAH